jgi:hypothetical protein
MDHDSVNVSARRFQDKCFGSALLPRQVRGVKDVIRRNVQVLSKSARVCVCVCVCVYGYVYLCACE